LKKGAEGPLLMRERESEEGRRGERERQSEKPVYDVIGTM